jgi:release factor glutamine methyltransferase
MAETEVWTLGRLLQWTTDYLRKQGAESPRLDAEVLLAHVRGCPRIALYTSFDEPADDAQRQRFRDLVKRRAAGTPVAYLVGYREFYSLRFDVTPDVLIPRPETEFLVVAMLDCLGKGSDKSAHVVDVGTGSGAIAVCAAKHAANCQVIAVDISPAALIVAAGNAERHEVDGRIEFIEGDLLAGLSAEPKFDVIASNPPYVSAAEMQKLPRDVRDFEPHLALLGGERGTEIISRLIPQAAERLIPGGSLLMEISPMIHNDVCELLAADARFAPATTIKDLAGLARVVSARRA